MPPSCSATKASGQKSRSGAEDTESNALRFIRAQPGLEHYLTTRDMMAAKFGQWDYLARIPFPDSSPTTPGQTSTLPDSANPLDPHSSNFCSILHLKLAAAIWYFGRGMADAQQKKSTQDDLFAFNQAMACVADSDPGWHNNSASAILGVVHQRLLSRIA